MKSNALQQTGLDGDIARLYLSEMGATPLLDEQEEVRLAGQLASARRAIAKLAQALPESCREVVLAGDESGPQLGAGWPLGDLEGFLRKLAHYAAHRPDSNTTAALRKVRAHKARLDGARDGLILANLRLVVHVAKKYAKGRRPLLDLIQDGNLGLLRAVEKFEHQRGNKFVTYAYWWITQSVERGIAEKTRTIRVPVNVHAALRKVESAAGDVRQRIGRQPTPSEIARQLGLTVGTVDRALSVVQEPLPLEHPAGDRGAYDVARHVPDIRTPSPFQQAVWRQLEQRVGTVLRELDPREQTILRLRFGIGHGPARTLDQIGKRLHLSRERVRQIESRAMAKLKASSLCRDLAGPKSWRAMPLPARRP